MTLRFVAVTGLSAYFLSHHPCNTHGAFETQLSPTASQRLLVLAPKHCYPVMWDTLPKMLCCPLQVKMYPKDELIVSLGELPVDIYFACFL